MKSYVFKHIFFQ